MRIIAGQHRGRKLLPPEGDITRPVTDRVKQSLFDILTPLLPDARVYDCFAGTGSMGLECLSRGAARVTFFESDRSAAKILKQNIDALGIGDLSHIVTTDIFQFFQSAIGNRQSAIIFLDPPYRFLTERAADLQSLATALASHLTADGTLVFRHDSADSLDFPSLIRYDSRRYGNM